VHPSNDSPTGRPQQEAVQVRAILIPGVLWRGGASVLPAEGAAAGADNSHSGGAREGSGLVMISLQFINDHVVI